MHEVLVNCLFKLAQEKVWLGELTVAVDLGRKATKQTNKQKRKVLEILEFLPNLRIQILLLNLLHFSYIGDIKFFFE